MRTRSKSTQVRTNKLQYICIYMPLQNLAHAYIVISNVDRKSALPSPDRNLLPRCAGRCFLFGIIAPILLRLVPENVVRAGVVASMHMYIRKGQQMRVSFQ